MGADLIDWKSVLSEPERQAVGRILASFTYLEQGVGDYWSSVVSRNFPKPEIFKLASAYAQQEAIHAEAYNHLSATLGLDEYGAFLENPVAQKKVASVLNYEHGDSPERLLVSLAVFSGFIEGVALYSSFAVLLSFARVGKLKGVGQILSWSVADERNHSDSAIRLFHTLRRELCADSEGVLPDPLKRDVYEGARAVVAMERDFIEDIFGGEDLPTISKEQAWSFVLHRANLKLTELGLKPIFSPDPDLALQVSSWFYPLTEGQVLGDFFALRTGGEYEAHAEQNFSELDYGSLLSGLV